MRGLLKTGAWGHAARAVRHGQKRRAGCRTQWGIGHGEGVGNV